MKMLSLQEVAVTVALINGNYAFGSTRVFGLPLELFILLVVVVDIIIAAVIIVVAMKKLKPTSREEEVEEEMQEIALTEIKGIGPKKAEELKAVGVNTVLDLAKSSAKDLSQKTGIPEKTISRWIVQANRIHEHMEVLSELRRQNSSS